ncbi:hypothetical protein [Arcobacter sp. YIC-80]
MFNNIVFDVIFGLLFISAIIAALPYSFWVAIHVDSNEDKN